MSLFRRGGKDVGIAPRHPHAGLLRRERRALLKARDASLKDLGGLLVDMYRRGGFRDVGRREGYYPEGKTAALLLRRDLV